MALFNRTSSGRLWAGRSSSSSLNEINLREEFHDLLFGSSSEPQRGHWVVYRRFNLASKVANYDDVYSVGPDVAHGETRRPLYNYTDTLVMTRHDPVFSPELAEASMPAGILKGGQSIFYFEYTVRPSENDQIFDIDWSDHRVTPPSTILNGNYLKKYNIKEVFDYRGDGGNIEYWICYVNTDLVNA